MTNIYQDGTYLEKNPSLHEEDSEYKFAYIRELLQDVRPEGGRFRVLDIGGGLVSLRHRFADFSRQKGFQSSAMLLICPRTCLQNKGQQSVRHPCNVGLQGYPRVRGVRSGTTDRCDRTYPRQRFRCR